MHRIFWPPKNTFITETTRVETESYDDWAKIATIADLSETANMSAVWTNFKISEKDPGVSI